MSSNPTARRIQRLKSECEISMFGVLVMTVACAAIVLWLMLESLLDGPANEQLSQPEASDETPASVLPIGS